ncbi:MAG: aminoacetone oxidase family FAD-binding enzyme [Planctomicrobium sp.]|nr:aminoacetone oxidase family FAD-binding enzyme [Planctomicrobium sp.]
MTEALESNSYDVLIIGGGAAGLMAAVLLARQSSELKIAVLDGAKRLGAKILISGGGRCNVTNVSVTAKDFSGGSRNVIKRTLKAFSAKQTVQFFADLGVELHEEEHGKLFPDSNKARTVLEALIESAESQGVHLLTDQRVESIQKQDDTFSVGTQQAEFKCTKVIMATGGRSIPKTGSDGFGYELAKSLGHSITETVPALAPMLLDGEFHEGLSGIALETELTLRTKSSWGIPNPCLSISGAGCRRLF